MAVMCFSATASFVTVAFTGVAGLAAVTRAGPREEVPLAAVPLVFAVQQSRFIRMAPPHRCSWPRS